MAQDTKRSDQAIDVVDKIVDLGRQIWKEKRKQKDQQQLSPGELEKEWEKSIGDDRSLPANKPQ